jgi:RNA polymerase sigma factor (sigma-70 family)
LKPPSSAAESRAGAERWFATTHWSVVLAAGRADSREAAGALETLCRAYWYPLYAYLRRTGFAPADAEDLTQDFFARLIEKNFASRADRQKGRFRSFLLAALRNFLADERTSRKTQKRGGGQPVLSLDTGQGERCYRAEPGKDLDPEKLFERRWAEALLDQVMAALEAECRREGKERLFAELRCFLPGSQEERTQAEVGGRLGISEHAVACSLYRLRGRYRALLREQVAHTVERPEDIDNELRHLIAVLS